MLAVGGWRHTFAVLRRPAALAMLLAAAALIGVNWLGFIWAVEHDRVLEASFGYFVNPLVNVLLGVVFLGERMRRAQAASVKGGGAR